MPYVYITSFSGPPATITVCDTLTGAICYTYPTQLTDLGPFPFIINLPTPFDTVGGITLTAQSDNGCSIVQSNVCSILPTPSPTSAPVPCFEVVINGDFNSNLSGWSASNPTYWTWDSFSGGSAIWTGMDDSQNELTQTGYTFIDGFSYTINYDVYNTDPLGGFVWAQLGVNTSIDISQPIPISPVSAWTQYSTNLLCAGGTQLSMNGSSDTLPVYLDNVSACFTYGPCYYMEFGTNENFGILGTGEVQYLDCNGVLQTYSAATAGNFYLCAVQSPGSIDIDVIGEDYLCENVGGDWYGPILESPTPTPSNPPTPTPSVTSNLFFYEPFVYYYSYNTTNTARTVNISFTFYPEYFGQPFSANVGGNIYSFVAGSSPTQTYTIPVTGTTGTLTISALTTTVGQITSIKNMYGVTQGSTSSVSPLTASTQNHAKCVNAETIRDKCVMTGDTQFLSGLTNTTTIIMDCGGSTVTGWIGHIPNNVRTINFEGFCTVYGDVSDIPNDIQLLDLRGYCQITGNTSSFAGKFVLPTGNNAGGLVLHGYSNITGLMSNLPDVATIEINPVWPTGVNGTARPVVVKTEVNPTGSTISGALTFKPRNVYVNICGANTISGNITALSGYNLNNLTMLNNGFQRTVSIFGYNTIGGSVDNISRWPKQFMIIGNNTISGSVTNIPVVTSVNSITQLSKFQITQLGNHNTTDENTIQTIVSTGNTINGNISSLIQWVNCDMLIVGGANSIIGNIASLNGGSKIPFIRFFIATQQPSLTQFNGIVNSDIFRRTLQNDGLYQGDSNIIIMNSNVGNGLPTSQVNNLLQHLNLYFEDDATTLIKINGAGIGAPSGVGLTAKNSLLTKQYNVVTN